MTRKQYLRLLKKLRARAKALGCPIEWRRLKGPSEIRGGYNVISHKIRIDIRGQVTYLKRLATLAHEIRHAEHKVNRQFKTVYDVRWHGSDADIVKLFLKTSRKNRPSIKESVAAENDCNHFAIYWLRNQGVNFRPNKANFNFFQPYPVEFTHANFVHYLVQEYRRKQQIN